MIGIFDSGYGGLTILQALKKELPEYSYMYLGDNDRAPYGARTKEEIYLYTTQGIEYLFSQECELVILACNTASACALRKIQQKWLPKKYPDKRVLGIVVPTIEQITGAASQTTIGMLATQQTISSGAYKREIHKRNPDINFIQHACPTLVHHIEEHAPHNIVRKEAKQCINALMQDNNIDALLLGCTHYELIADTIRGLLPKKITLYEQPKIVAKSLQRYLQHHKKLSNSLIKKGICQFMTTGDPKEASKKGKEYFSHSVVFNLLIPKV